MRLLWGLAWVFSFCASSLQKPRLLLFSPSVVNLGTPLSVGVQLLDAPPGQEVKGSVFLRNPKGGSCSPKKDFKLSSGDDFVLLSLEVPLEDVRSCGLFDLRRAPPHPAGSSVSVAKEHSFQSHRDSGCQLALLFPTRPHLCADRSAYL